MFIQKEEHRRTKPTQHIKMFTKLEIINQIPPFGHNFYQFLFKRMKLSVCKVFEVSIQRIYAKRKLKLLRPYF